MKGEFNLETTIGEIKQTKFGKWIYRYISRQQMKDTVSKKANSEAQIEDADCTDFVQNARIKRIESMPIRSLVLFSEGKLDFRVANALLMILNGKKGGFKKMMNAYNRRKKINKITEKNR